jgi:hypothetical protein
MILTFIRFGIYIYLGLQFAILFFVFMKGYKLKKSDFPKYLFLMFFSLSLVFILLGFLVIIKQFDRNMNSNLSAIIIIPSIPLVYFAHRFIQNSLPNKK